MIGITISVVKLIFWTVLLMLTAYKENEINGIILAINEDEENRL